MIILNPSFRQVETHKLSDPYNEGVLFGVKPHFVLSDPFEYSLKMFVAKFVCTGLYFHIVHVHFPCFPFFILEYFVHHSLVGFRDVLESEWHDIILVIGLCDHERDFYLVGYKQGYLVVSEVCIHER